MARQRRPRGSGKIQRQPNGTYIARTSDGSRSGRFAVRSDAEKALTDWNAQIAMGRDLAAARQRVRQFLATWLDVKRDKVRPRTLEFYTRHCQYSGPYIGDMALEGVRPLHLERMFGSLTDAGLAPRSVFHVRAVLRAAFRDAVKWKVLRESPIDGTDAPKVEAFDSVALDAAQCEALLAIADAHRLRALIHLAVGLGFRQGELLNARWDDYDIERQTLYVRTAKSKAGRRYLPLSQEQAEIVEAHRQNQLEEAQIVQKRAAAQAEKRGEPTPLIVWNPTGLIFCSEAGTPILPRNLLRAFKAMLKAARLPTSIRFHDLRHTAITYMVIGGADPKAVQALAGHADAQTTFNLYAKAQAERARTVVEQAEAQRKRRKQG